VIEAEREKIHRICRIPGVTGIFIAVASVSRTGPKQPTVHFIVPGRKNDNRVARFCYSRPSGG
jgi:hypothetical protein